MLGVRLNRHDATCTEDAIYMDQDAIALRPTDMTDMDWHALCRYICGTPPRGVRQPVAFDPEVQKRLAEFDRTNRTDALFLKGRLDNAGRSPNDKRTVAQKRVR